MNSEPLDEPCPFCVQPHLTPFHRDRKREYRRCRTCFLISVPSQDFLSAEREKAEYDLHQNHPDDAGYRRFLSRLSAPLIERLSPASQGLDFGCGPGPTLSVMLEEAGHQVALYDPFYAPDSRVLNGCYDFIAATEVVEHLHRPMDELSRLWNRLRPNGWLAIMTKLALGQKQFTAWHYKNDLTHVCFFSRPTFEWFGNQLRSPPTFIGNDVIFFQKPPDTLCPKPSVLGHIGKA